MSRPSKLVHPATLFIQALPSTEVAFKDMTPAQQTGLYEFMDCDGDGIWAEHCNSKEEAIKLFGDVKFTVGKFANDDTMKIAFVEATPEADYEHPLEWFAEMCICDDPADAIPVVLNSPEIAPEVGLLEWGYDHFYGYWAKQPETEFVGFRRDWNPNDTSGRGGQ